MSTQPVTPNPNGSLDQRCEWVKSRHKRKGGGQVDAPRLKISERAQASASIINQAAVDQLTRDGEEYAYVIVRDGKLILMPIPMQDGAINVIRIHRRGRGCAVVCLGKEAKSMIDVDPGQYLIGTWDDSEGVMVFEVAK